MTVINVGSVKDLSNGDTVLVNDVPIRSGAIDPDNKIINGSFDFWQRGTNFTWFDYGADRWVGAQVGGTCSHSRQAFPLGTKIGNNTPSYFLRYSISGQTLASEYVLFFHPIEGVESYAGETITILGWARRSSGSGNMTVEMTQTFGTGGTPSSAVAGNGATTVTLGSDWAPFAVTINVPSVSGKILGTNGDDYVALCFWLSAGSNFTFRSNSLGLQTMDVDFWGIHIKVGTHTVAACDLYHSPDMTEEALRCYRYYYRQIIGNAHTYLYYPSNNANVHWRHEAFPVPMRKIPTASFTTPTYVNSSGLTIIADTLGWMEKLTVTAAGVYDAYSYTVSFNAEL